MLDRTVEILSRLVAYPTLSTDSNLELIDYAADLLSSAGARLTFTTDEAGQRANVYATFGPDVAGGVVLAAHTDVVPAEGQDWTGDPFLARLEDGRVLGRGTADMKGFIACVLAVTPMLAQAARSRPVHVALTYDEEVGCHGAKVMLDRLVSDHPLPAFAIVGEPTELQIVVAHKGCYEYTTEIHGVERHASMGSGGAGAIGAAARFIGMLDGLAEDLARRAPDDSPFDPPGTTINVGKIAGGVARNITAGSAIFDWEIRPIERADLDFALDQVDRFVEETLLPSMRAEFPQASVTTATVGAVGGLRAEPGGEAVALARRLTGNTDLLAVPFGTEAGLYQELGISTVVCGPGTIDQAHKPDESIGLPQLDACLQMLGRLSAELA